MPFAALSQVRLEYFEHGHGLETVVFIHGFQASARIWHFVQEALPADLYRSIAINNRGAGQSDAPAEEGAFGIEMFAADAYELTRRLGLQNFTLVGHSLGGATVAQFAVDHPEVLKGLVLLDPTDPDGRDISEDEIERLIDARMAARREQIARGGGGDGIDARTVGEHEAGDVRALLVADINAAPERRLRGSMRSRLHLRLGDRVRDLQMPVLVCGGDADALIPLDQMLRTWAKYPPGTGLHIWHGVGHSPNLDIPSDLAAVLRHFVEQTVPAAHERAPAAIRR